VPTEEKWGVVERPADQGSRPGNGAGNGAAWLSNGNGRRPAPVEPTDRQRLAVEAYCRELCPPDAVPAATTEALSAFSVSAARLGHRATPADHARVLSSVMRAAAASHAAVEPSGLGWRSRVVDALTAERDVGCRRVPGLLARRANGDLAGGEAAALRDHLRDCVRCRATELRMARAERTFATASRLGVMPPGVTGVAFTAATAVTGATAVTAANAAAAPSMTADWTAAPVAAAAAAGADAAHAAPATPGPSAAPTAPAAPPTPKTSPAHRRRLGPIPVAAGVGVLAVCGVAAAAVLGGGGAPHVATNAASPPSTAATATPIAATPVQEAHHAAVVHHRVHKPKPKPKPKPAPTPVVSTTVTSTTPTTTSNTGSTGTTGSTGNTGVSSPAASAPVASAPAPTSSRASSGGGGGSSSGSSATIQQPSLGATSAPTQGIGNKH
jgi:hypothetical protein